MFGRAVIVTQGLASLGIPAISIYGTPGIVLVYVLTLYPYVLLPTVAGLKALDVSVEEASQNLGASRWRTFRHVIFPIVIPSVLAGALLVFIETLENFGVPFVLAEDRPILSVEAYKLFVGETTDNPASAGVLGVLLVFCTVLALLIQRRVLSRRNFSTGTRRSAAVMPVTPAIRRLGAAYCWGLVGLALSRYICRQTHGLHGDTADYWGEDYSLDENEDVNKFSPEMCDYYNATKQDLFEQVSHPAMRSDGGVTWPHVWQKLEWAMTAVRNWR